MVEYWVRPRYRSVTIVSTYRLFGGLYFAAFLVVFDAGHGAAQGNFYQGKIVTVVVGSAPGS
jgi:hypothetical protein